MGSIFAPNYANLFMGFFLSIVMYLIREKIIFVHASSNGIDTLMIYSVFFWEIKNEVWESVSILNNFVDDLEFTLEVNASRVHFLDMWVQKNEGKLITTLFTKETDRNTLLLATSFHLTFF